MQENEDGASLKSPSEMAGDNEDNECMYMYSHMFCVLKAVLSCPQSGPLSPKNG